MDHCIVNCRISMEEVNSHSFFKDHYVCLLNCHDCLLSKEKLWKPRHIQPQYANEKVQIKSVSDVEKLQE